MRFVNFFLNFIGNFHYSGEENHEEMHPGEDFNKELEAVHDPWKNQPLIGACTLGEIANSGPNT